MDARVLLVCFVLIALVETGAGLLSLWVYRSRILMVLFVVLGTLATAGIATALSDRHIASRFLAGAVFGVFLEATNWWITRTWRFPGDRFFFLRRPGAIVLATGIPWGFVTAGAPELARLL